MSRRHLPLAALLALASARTAVAARPASAAPPTPPVVVAQVPAGALPAEARGEGLLRGEVGEGGRLLLVSAAGATRVLSAGFHSAADPEVSFDGGSILFAAKKEKADPWCVWEMRADGSGAHKITCGAAGARQPVYQSTVYTITSTNVEPWVQVAFAGTDPGERNEAGVAPNTSLWSCKMDGSALRRLTFNLSNDFDPTILPDGRMVYATWLGRTARGRGRVALVGVNEDGSDYQTYAGEQGLRVEQMPTPSANGLVVFVESDALAGDGGGRLASVSQVRPLHTYRSLTADADGRFRSPSSLPDGRLLVSWRQPGGGTYGIYRFEPETKARETVLEDPAWHSLQARLLAPRAVPDARSSVVRDDDAEGRLYAIDVGINDLGRGWPQGAAKRLRVLEGVAAGEGRPASRRLLGEIPVAEDGSFQVQLPANTPVQLQLLDAEGLALRSSAWLWVRNHGAQGCVGCHEDPERTPPNRFVKAVQSPAPVLNQPPEKRRAVGYAADVKAIVESRCLGCHGTPGKAPALDATAAGMARFAATGEARRSRLLWHLLGRNTARPWDPEAPAAAPLPLPEAQRPSPAEIRAFIEWIDLGGQP